MDHKTDTDSAEQWKCGNEFLPYHPSASHVDPAYRDGWNACYRASLAASAGSEPVASIYITPAGEREMDDWKVYLPVGQNILFIHPSPPEGMVGGWQSIATAPKDGTRVIIAEGGKVVRAWYVVVPYSETRDTDGRYIDHTDHDEFWMGDDGDVYDEPTHWQPEAPLPPPPLSEEGASHG